MKIKLTDTWLIYFRLLNSKKKKNIIQSTLDNEKYCRLLCPHSSFGGNGGNNVSPLQMAHYVYS